MKVGDKLTDKKNLLHAEIVAEDGEQFVIVRHLPGKPNSRRVRFRLPKKMIEAGRTGWRKQ